MNITITINTNNAAFDDNPEHEILRLLALVSRMIKQDAENGILDVINNPFASFSGYTVQLMDSNGNACGKFSIKES